VDAIDVVADQFEDVLDELDVTGTCRGAHGADMIGEPFQIEQVIVELRDLGLHPRNLLVDVVKSVRVCHREAPNASVRTATGSAQESESSIDPMRKLRIAKSPDRRLDFRVFLRA
jgi:hypothetical protein